MVSKTIFQKWQLLYKIVMHSCNHHWLHRHMVLTLIVQYEVKYDINHPTLFHGFVLSLHCHCQSKKFNLVMRIAKISFYAFLPFLRIEWTRPCHYRYYRIAWMSFYPKKRIIDQFCSLMALMMYLMQTLRMKYYWYLWTMMAKCIMLASFPSSIYSGKSSTYVWSRWRSWWRRCVIVTRTWSTWCINMFIRHSVNICFLLLSLLLLLS